MKKTITIATIIFSFILLSCKKEYNCSCTYPGLKDPEVSNLKMKKEEATSYCNSLSIDYKALNGQCYLITQ